MLSGRKVRFFGTGEPTMRMDMIRELADYTKSKWSPVDFAIQTNGFFPMETTKWIADWCNDITVSCDGPADIHDLQRPTKGGQPSSKVVEANIKYFVEREKAPKVRATISALGVDRQKDIVDYFTSLGVKEILVDHIFGRGELKNGVQKADYLTYAKNFIQAYEYAQTKGAEYWCSFMSNVGKEVEQHCRGCSPTPHLLPDGSISSCDLVTSRKQEGSEQLIYGVYDPTNRKIEYYPAHQRLSWPSLPFGLERRRCGR